MWTEQQTSGLIERFSVHARERGYGLLAVRERRSLQLIGHCGLSTIAETAEIEVAYLIDRPFWDRGFEKMSQTRPARRMRTLPTPDSPIELQ